MPLRSRLAVWYGTLTGVVLLLVGLLTYAEHTRAHYDDMDRTLLYAALHARTGLQQQGAGRSLTSPAPPDVALRYYARGRVTAETPAARAAPPLNPRAILGQQSTRPFDPVAGLAPPIMAAPAGTGRFTTVRDPRGARWRVYVLPDAGGLLVALTSLQRVDAAVAGLRELVILSTIAGLAFTLAAGWLLAGRVLRPVALLTATAERIARSRSFRQRVPAGGTQDEMGRMAVTFNQMLAGLEEAYAMQQRFVADASHELRAPLTAIQANLELLERHRALPPEEREVAVREASREAHRLTALVNDLLSLARADAGVALDRRRVELDGVVLQTVATARHLASERRLEVESLEPVTVLGDEERLRQLVLIVLDNALKYTSAGGTVAVAVRRDGEKAAIVVRDTGIGIDANDLPHVFERFYRADVGRSRDAGGTGLGLSIARWIAEQHGGRIAIESRPNQGTTVTTTLPLAP